MKNNSEVDVIDRMKNDTQIKLRAQGTQENEELNLISEEEIKILHKCGKDRNSTWNFRI